MKLNKYFKANKGVKKYTKMKSNKITVVKDNFCNHNKEITMVDEIFIYVFLSFFYNLQQNVIKIF